jgi:hypothetical protein
MGIIGNIYTFDKRGEKRQQDRIVNKFRKVSIKGEPKD